MRTLLVAALLLPTAAAAQRGVGVELGLRLAWAPAFGSAADLVPMSEAIDWQVPLQADVLWSAERFAAGVYGSWGPGHAGAQGCTGGASCSAQAFRAGVQALWRFPRWSLGAATTTTWNGPELGLQGGAEWRIRRRFGVGPFVGVGLGRYERVAVDTPEAFASGSIADRSVHAWLHLGVRGTIGL